MANLLAEPMEVGNKLEATENCQASYLYSSSICMIIDVGDSFRDALVRCDVDRSDLVENFSYCDHHRKN